VNPGDLLFVIDPRPYEATQAAAQAQLGQATAQVELAQRQLGRSAELRKKDFEPASSYDQRVSELKVATAAIESAKAAIRSAQLMSNSPTSPRRCRVGSAIIKSASAIWSAAAIAPARRR
jgi:multidrug resistance efflux pump